MHLGFFNDYVQFVRHGLLFFLAWWALLMLFSLTYYLSMWAHPWPWKPGKAISMAPFKVIGQPHLLNLWDLPMI